MPRTDPDPLRIRPFSNEKRRTRSVPRSARQTGGTAVGGSVDPGDLELMARGSVGPGLKPLHWAPLLPLFRRLLPFCGGRQYHQWNQLAKPVLITCSAWRMNRRGRLSGSRPGGPGAEAAPSLGALASIISTAASILWGAPVLPMEPAREAGSDHLLGRSDHLFGPADGLPGGTAVGGSVDLGGLELTARGPVGPGLKPRHLGGACTAIGACAAPGGRPPCIGGRPRTRRGGRR